MNKKILFNNEWEFAKSDLKNVSSEELKFEAVDIPHDWLIYNTMDLYENSIGWYRKKFEYFNKEGNEILLCFDGVYMDSTLYINGEFAGEWKYGYSYFEHDITDKLIYGENEIILKVIHQSPNSRWYSGAGIYRDVWLKVRDINHILTDGVYISNKEKDNIWEVEIDTEVKIYEEAQISNSIVYEDKVIAKVSQNIYSEVGDTIKNTQKIFIENPLLWEVDNPNLYKVITELYLIKSDENLNKYKIKVEAISQNIGFRKITLDPNKGFLINGVKMKLNGVCEHHDLGALGAAFNKSALRKRFTILKEMGVNAIRTAHNMPAPGFMELADEMGMFVVSEAFDIWERAKTNYDYSRFFNEWAKKDIKSWVMRDRNHPSLLMWSIGNEIYDTHLDEKGQEITKRLRDYVKEYDYKENARITIASNYMPWENAQKCADILKVAGYNYAEKYYEKHHEEYPDWIIYGSETASIVQSRGIYHFPFEKSILADDDEQCFSLGNSTTSWGAKSIENCILAERDTSFSLGQFIWTGFDYIGEPTPYHTKNSYFGQIDTATFKKDAYYIYQAEWTNYKKNPMIHIFPYWDFNKGQIIDVRVCSNAPEIELQLNGVTLGRRAIDHKYGKELLGWWKIPFEEGEIKAIAYDEAGNIIAVDRKRSFKDAKKICLSSDKEEMVANGSDLIFVEITMEDEDGNKVENANNRVNIEVTGEGRLIGLDNGDSTDYDQYKGVSRRLFSGKLMAIIASTLNPGDIYMEVSSLGMKKQTMNFKSIATEKNNLYGVSAFMKNKDVGYLMGVKDEIPVRKIEIISKLGQNFHSNLKEIYVEAVLYPKNTSYKEIEWSIVNDLGIKSNIAKIEPFEHLAKITALGDGEFRVRCTSKNGSDKIKIISELEFKSVGLGEAYKNPYEFISAGLYDYSKGDIGNGNERGIATSREGETQVGFLNIDFGSYGSNIITIPIFALSSTEYSLQIWEGQPYNKDSILLCDGIYKKESKWNVYQEETYVLSKRLCGITSIYFVLHDKVHIKGFTFKKINRALEKNMVLDCNRIYGDTFKIQNNSIESIGNNVSIEFLDMDFTKAGISKIVICGRTPIDKNTINIQFSSDDSQINQLIEFSYSNEYEEKVFELNKIQGLKKVTFIFLPGSNFDFKWFRFIQ